MLQATPGRLVVPGLFALLALATAGACGGSSESTQLKEVPLPHVRLDEVTLEAAAARSRHIVVLEPIRDARLGARLGGEVLSLDAGEEQRVRKGQVLVRLADAGARGGLQSAQAALARAEEQLAQAERDLDIAEQLAAEGARSDRELERSLSAKTLAEAGRDEARGAVRQARDRLGAMVLRAPFAGTVIEIQAEIGELLPPGSPVLRLADLRSLRLGVPLTQQEARAHDAGGLRFEVTVRGEPLEAKLDWLSSAAPPDSLTFPARLLVPNPDRRLRAGELAEVRVHSGAAKPVATVLPSSVRWSGEESYVLVLEGERVRRRKVSVGADLLNRLQVSGVTEGEKVVSSGPLTLDDGDRVVAVTAGRP